ncbi:PLP-dependent aminotransferase family protein [Fictibacillus sp. BK138]|uniref:MocR-like pyridoxine biosynthesis transcription factor PdxR n=1 Tax=Fictibacillus sp. BK138 TaxID=2512121 RepID=UPI001028846A|nr:PLP-dependent aminotransferase family protein [Fictibacillus sp. BK138]RZT21652.1 GntR family transcriptional regulator/MocR family aminotransferase [Fictibacillus sp. BK138]
MVEITPSLDTHSNKPLYIQLYHFIKQEVQNGNLAQKTKLPSKRKLAKHLNLSQNTIESAYSQLVAEGYIESIPRKGYFVCEVDQNHVDVNRNISIVKEKTYRDRTYTFDFTNTGIEGNAFPFSVYRKIVGEVIRTENKELLLLGHPQGEYGLREEISKYVYESRGVRCSPSQIIIGGGTPYLIKVLFQLLNGSTFAVEDPGYHRKLVLFENPADKVKMIPLDEGGLVVSELEKSGANAVFVTPSHQFPCGMVMPIARRLQLLKWAEEKTDRFIIEDDYDSEFRYEGKPIPGLQGLDTSENVIYMSTFSKALIPSLRISYMILPKPLLTIYQNDYFFYTQTVSRIDQEILKRFIKERQWEKHINRMRVVYQKKRDALVAEISRCFRESVEIIGQDAGLHILVRPNNGMTEKELVESAAACSIRVYPVSAYGRCDHQTVLMGFAVLSVEEIKKAVELLAGAWFK